MAELDIWRFDINAVGERLALGLDMFGPYATWLWIMPVIWMVTLISLWLYMGWQQRQSDRAFLAYASRNLPLLQQIARHRAHEVSRSRTYDPF
ncbi:MAG: hypothetical protein AAF543_05945 [Pseudomonadota bacterium]